MIATFSKKKPTTLLNIDPLGVNANRGNNRPQPKTFTTTPYSGPTNVAKPVKTSTSTTQTTVPQPKVEQPKQQSYVDQYLNNIGVKQTNFDQGLNRDRDFLQKRTDGFVKQQGVLYDMQNKQLKEQVPILEKTKKQTVEQLYQNLALAKQGAELKKGSIEDQAGETMREQAQAKRETDAARERKFAALGTIDSGGFQGYAGQQANADTQFLNNQAKTQKERDARLSEIDIEIVRAENDTKASVDNEIAKFKEAVRQINNAVNMNDLQKRQLIENAYMDLEGALNEQLRVYNDNVANLEKEKLSLAQTLSAPQKGISQTFLETGIPQTAEDREYFLKNKDKTKNASGQKESILTAVNNLIDSTGIGAMTGVLKTDLIPGTEGALAKNQLEQLKGLLSLENRQLLQGSGAISDFESRTLERAASVLGQNLSEEQFRKELQTLKTNLEVAKLRDSGFSDQEIQEFYSTQ